MTLYDPTLTAEERAALIRDREEPKLKAIIMHAVKLGRDGKIPYATKAERLIDLAEGINRTLTPYTPCSKGCSHCCRMATLISGYEAAMIGRYIGRTPVKVGRQHMVDDEMQQHLLKRFTGSRCTFLSDDGRCTVYPVRPIACRIHHSVDKDERACIIENLDVGPVQHAPSLDFSLFQAMIAFIVLEDEIGDIREFFPELEKH